MTKPELGIKRLCAECGARYYDLNTNPITCPKCGAPFQGSGDKDRPAHRATSSSPAAPGCGFKNRADLA